MTTWIEPGHPGQCPRCGSPHVLWKWKPDLAPTTERFTCANCGWDLIRNFKGDNTVSDKIVLEWDDRTTNVVKGALTYWIGAAEHKVKVVREKEEETKDTPDIRSVALKADIEHVKTVLPIRLECARQALNDIRAGGRTAHGI